MKLAIFDVDGTLTDTNGVDNLCFARAFSEALGVPVEKADWQGTPHVTDSAVFEFLFEKRFARKPDVQEKREFKSKFISLLEECRLADSACFREINGAATAFRRMQHADEWMVVIATGCWGDSATFKLDACRIQHRGVPTATADDAMSREKIVGNAIWKACRHFGYPVFEKIVSVGDGTWDVQTARNMRLPFVGIGDADGKLKNSGANHILRDLADFDALVDSLESAKIPADL